MKSDLPSSIIERLQQHSECETALGRRLCATDYPMDPLSFPEGPERMIAEKVQQLQREGIFEKELGKPGPERKNVKGISHTSRQEHDRGGR